MLIYYLTVFRQSGFVRFCTLEPRYKAGKVVLWACVFLWGYSCFSGVLFKTFLNCVVLWGSFNGCGFKSLRKLGSC